MSASGYEVFCEKIQGCQHTFSRYYEESFDLNFCFIKKPM